MAILGTDHLIFWEGRRRGGGKLVFAELSFLPTESEDILFSLCERQDILFARKQKSAF